MYNYQANQDIEYFHHPIKFPPNFPSVSTTQKQPLFCFLSPCVNFVYSFFSLWNSLIKINQVHPLQVYSSLLFLVHLQTCTTITMNQLCISINSKSSLTPVCVPQLPSPCSHWSVLHKHRFDFSGNLVHMESYNM